MSECESNDAHDAITHRFPTEILLQIFQHTFPTVEEVEEKIYAIPFSGPHIMASISSRWRTIAIGTPSLWTVIPLILRTTQNPRPLRRMLKVWLKRGGATMPLSIAIHFETSSGQRYWAKHGGTIADIMQKINSVSHRLVHFRANGANIAMRHLFFGAGVPNLRSLEFVHAADNYDDAVSGDGDEMWQVNFGAESAPSSLILAHCHSSQLQISLRNLRHAEIRFLPVTECLEIIKNSPQLESLWLNGCTNNLEESFDVIRHSRINTLQISGDEMHRPVTYVILQALCLPSLKSISLTEQHYDRKYAAATKHLLALLHRSCAPLESLTLKHIGSSLVRHPSITVNNFLSEIIHLIQPTLRQLTIQMETHALDYCIPPQDFIDSIIIPGSNCRSVTVSGGVYLWSHLLLHMVRAVAAASNNTHVSEIIMYLDARYMTTVHEALFYSCFDKAKLACPESYASRQRMCPKGEHIVASRITLSEVKDMLSLIEIHKISVKIYHIKPYVNSSDMFDSICGSLRQMCSSIVT